MNMYTGYKTSFRLDSILFVCQSDSKQLLCLAFLITRVICSPQVPYKDYIWKNELSAFLPPWHEVNHSR